jgi:type I restriction enzyme S subunit
MNPLSEWHGQLPSHWPLVPLRYVAELGTGHTPDRARPEYWEDCDIPWVTAADLSSRPSEFEPLIETAQHVSALGVANSAAVVHPPGTVMFCRTASVGLLTVIGRPMATTQAFVSWSPGPRLLSRYLLYVLAAMRPELFRIAYGSTHHTIYMPDLEALRIPLPPLHEQRRIAEFLDDQVSRLDVAIKRREEQRRLAEQAALSEIAAALTAGGLSPRQPSGTPWLGDIPSSWTMGPVYGYYDVQLGKMLNEERAAGPNPFPYLRNANVHWFDISTDDLARMHFEPHESARYQVVPGDLLVCEGGAGVAEAAVWDGRISPCYFSKSLHRVRARGHLPVEWLMFWLRIAKHAGVFEAEGNLATIPHLTGEQLRAQRIPVPPAGDVSLRTLEERRHRLAAFDETLGRSSALLEERKQALITAAVTGQFDVTTPRAAA